MNYMTKHTKTIKLPVDPRQKPLSADQLSTAVAVEIAVFNRKAQELMDSAGHIITIFQKREGMRLEQIAKLTKKSK